MRVRAFLGFAAVFAVLNLANALHKGGDFGVFLEAGDRLLSARPLYEGSGPGIGVTWPPALSVVIAPFSLLAQVDERAARVSWYLVNLVALFGGVALWARALATAALPQLDIRRWRDVWSTPVLLALGAIALPAQTNFEHQNMNALLLLLTGAGALGCVRGATPAAQRRDGWSDLAGGAMLGVAAAIKAFPLLLVAYLAIRRQWRALAAAVLAGVLLTAATAFWYGPAGAWQTLLDWSAVSSAGDWPARVQNQSVFAMAMRLSPAYATVVSLVIAALLIIGLIWMAWRCRARPAAHLGPELAVALAAAVLISPIAWDHYWVLIFPVLLAAVILRRPVFWVAALLVTGLSPLTLGESGFNLARGMSNSTVAGLMLVSAVTAVVAAGAVRQKKGPHEAGL